MAQSDDTRSIGGRRDTRSTGSFVVGRRVAEEYGVGDVARG